MAYQVFIEAAHNAAFRRDGYVCMSLLSPEMVRRFQELFDTSPCECPQQFYTSLWSGNEAYRRRVHQEICGILEPLLAPVLNDHRLVLGNFAVKQAGADSQVPLHQDWTVVDESQYRSLTVWCPLVDVDGRNGCLQVVSRSHRFLDNLRPNFAEGQYYSLFADQEPLLRERYLREIPMRAGEAVIYDSGLLHASNPNRGNAVRVAVVGLAIPRQAALRHYYQATPHEAEVSEVGEDFYWRDVELAHPPRQARSLGVTPSSREALTAERIEAVMGEAG